MRKGKVCIGNVLIVKDGATTGKTAFVSEDFPFKEAAVNEHVFILRSYTQRCHEKVLFYVLCSPLGQEQIRTTFHGAAQGGINREFVKEVIIPLPPLDEQRRIVRHLEAVQAKVEALKEAQAATEVELKRLEQAILDRAFRGEL